MKFTCSFSNTPGPINYFTFKDRGFIKHCYPFVMVAGRVGLCVSCISYKDNFTIALSCDEAICYEPQRVVDLMEKHINEELEKNQDMKKEK